MVECFLAKEEVEGPNPSSRSKFRDHAGAQRRNGLVPQKPLASGMASWAMGLHGVVAALAMQIAGGFNPHMVHQDWVS